MGTDMNSRTLGGVVALYGWLKEHKLEEFGKDAAKSTGGEEAI
jgi:hypothetical protein